MSASESIARLAVFPVLIGGTLSYVRNWLNSRLVQSFAYCYANIMTKAKVVNTTFYMLMKPTHA